MGNLQAKPVLSTSVDDRNAILRARFHAGCTPYHGLAEYKKLEYPITYVADQLCACTWPLPAPAQLKLREDITNLSLTIPSPLILRGGGAWPPP